MGAGLCNYICSDTKYKTEDAVTNKVWICMWSKAVISYSIIFVFCLACLMLRIQLPSETWHFLPYSAWYFMVFLTIWSTKSSYLDNYYSISYLIELLFRWWLLNAVNKSGHVCLVICPSTVKPMVTLYFLRLIRTWVLLSEAEYHKKQQSKVRFPSLTKIQIPCRCELGEK